MQPQVDEQKIKYNLFETEYFESFWLRTSIPYSHNKHFHDHFYVLKADAHWSSTYQHHIKFLVRI